MGTTAPNEVIVPLEEPWPGTQGKVARAAYSPARGRGDAGGADTARPLGEALSGLAAHLAPGAAVLEGAAWGAPWRKGQEPGGPRLGVGLDSI